MLTLDEELELYRELKLAHGAHPMEAVLNLTSDAVLSAIQKMKMQDGMPWRMLRGSLADLLFEVIVVPTLTGWVDVPFSGDLPYDYKLRNPAREEVTLQIKLQRSGKNEPSVFNKRTGKNMFSVETQRTRGGTVNGVNTRPYRFGEFDILAVCMYPSTGRWDTYMYTVEKWLLPHAKEANGLATFQPVAQRPNADWTDSLERAIEWLKSGQRKTIALTDNPPIQQTLAL
jgi:ribosomal protein S16